MGNYPRLGRRIHICGTSAAGKSTLGRRLAEILHIPFHELDAISHLPGWQERPLEDFRRLTAAAAAQDAWVIDGNYGKARDIIRARADTIIWLDYSWPVLLRRLTRRTFKRWYTNELLWATNRESLWRHFLVPKDSLYWWVLTTYRGKQREADRLFASGEQADKIMIRFKSPRACDQWVDSIAHSASAETINFSEGAAD